MSMRMKRFQPHKGDRHVSYLGMPPTGKHVTSSGISIFRIAGGKIVEHWGENDALGTFQQLGLIPTPA